MKKYQFVAGICVGIIVGAVVALYFGNTLTGVLLGILACFATSYAIAIDWINLPAIRRKLSETAASAVKLP